MYNSKNQTITAKKENETSTTSVSSTSTKEEVSENIRNDKRYEEPFENDGAYADDDED